MPPESSTSRGLFITFEGIDCCGKSTQLKLVKKYLESKGYSVVTLREPGSTTLSEKVRSLLLNKKMKIDPYPELLLYLTARGQLVSEKIIPALKKNRIILCDRFHDSTVAYQGYGRRMDFDLIEKIRKRIAGKIKPNLTFVYDISPKTSLSRRKRSADRLESEKEEFFRRVRSGFRRIAANEPRRVKLINGEQTPAKVFAQSGKELDKALDKFSKSNDS
ncbi:MAG: dTMP kinase [candidate division Zixibacteria bacterium]|nr:dTMP kinase [candidate division Zixibacteria bacterium]